MSKYPLIEKMGLKVAKVDAGEVHWHEAVNATDLQAVLEKATVVYGSDEMKVSKENYHGWYNEEVKGDTHKALLICVEPIKKEPAKIKIHIYKDEQGNFASEVADEQVSVMGGYKYVTTKEVELP